MTGIYKIGFTTRDPLVRLTEANKSGTWKPPADYVIEFAKSVKNSREEETKLHRALVSKRLKGEFFRENLEVIMAIPEKVEGEWWTAKASTKLIAGNDE